MFNRIDSFSRKIIAPLFIAVCVIPLLAFGPEPAGVPDLLDREPLRDNPYMSYSNPTSWSAELNAYTIFPWRYEEGFLVNFIYHDRVVLHHFQVTKVYNDYKDAGIVFPIVSRSASSWSVPGSTHEVMILYDDDQIDLRIDRHLRQGVRGSEFVFRPPFTAWTTRMRVKIRTDMVCVDTRFDQQRAAKLDWPEQWPKEAERFLTPLLDTLGKLDDQRVEQFAHIPDPDSVVNLLSSLHENQSATGLSPVHEAKFLAAALLGVFHVNQTPMVHTQDSKFRVMFEWSERSPEKYEIRKHGNFDGFNVVNPDDAALNLRGSVHDRTAVLTSLYRAAGIPARTVVGLEHRSSGVPIYRSWTEFALYDEDLDLLVWVPVDLNELARSRVRPEQFRSTWSRFGSSKSLHAVVPIAFAFHPHGTNKTGRVPILMGIRPPSGSEQVRMFSEQFMNHRVEEFDPSSRNP